MALILLNKKHLGTWLSPWGNTRYLTYSGGNDLWWVWVLQIQSSSFAISNNLKSLKLVLKSAALWPSLPVLPGYWFQFSSPEISWSHWDPSSWILLVCSLLTILLESLLSTYSLDSMVQPYNHSLKTLLSFSLSYLLFVILHLAKLQPRCMLWIELCLICWNPNLERNCIWRWGL